MESKPRVNRNHLAVSAERLASLTKTLPGLLDILDLLAGAIYSLQMAERLGFRDRPGELKPQYTQNLVKRLERMSKNELATGGLWLAGLHFNSAIQRLAACYRRSQDVFKRFHRRFTSKQGPRFLSNNLDSVTTESNKIKHDEYGLIAGREVAFAMALAALGDLLSELERRSFELKQQYSSGP